MDNYGSGQRGGRNAAAPARGARLRHKLKVKLLAVLLGRTARVQLSFRLFG